MRSTWFAFILAPTLAMSPSLSPAQTLTGTDWQLLAIDGDVVDMAATLRVEQSGGLSGKGPCNGWSAVNEATLPDLRLRGIRSTKMACPALAEEQTFFAALGRMTALRLEGSLRQNLILTGPDGRSIEFVYDRMNSLTRCMTCPAKD